MKIGIDINMDTNIAEGYLIMEFNHKRLIFKGQIDPKCYVRFYTHLPNYLEGMA